MSFEIVSEQDGVVKIRLDNGEWVRVIDSGTHLTLVASGRMTVLPTAANALELSVLLPEPGNPIIKIVDTEGD